MHKFLRLLSLTIAAATSLGAAAQGHTIFVAGHANPCSPAIAGSTVTIASLGAITGVQTMATAVLNENCYYYAEILVADTAGWVAVEGPCGNGQNTVDTLFYSLTPPFTIDLIIDLNCGIAPPACQACISMDQTAPNTATFTSCSSGGVGPYTYLWDISGPGGGGVQGSSISHSFTGPGQYVVCLNLTDSEGCTSSTCQQVYVDAQGNLSNDAPNDCQACFNITQSQGGGALLPWSIDLTSCSVGSGTLLAEWQLPNGSWSNGNTITYVANSPGLNYFCLYLSSTNGCTSVFCDSVYFDTNGYLMNDPIVYDCLQIPNGPNMPGTPCSNPAVEDGTWDANCNCVPNSTGECEADFYIIQAYENGDTTGTGVPVPNTLWVWNLSNGGSGLYQFLWNFGDGTSSTDPFPTHTYAGSGPYILCLTISDSEGCTNTHCDSVYVDDNGLYNGLVGDGGNRSNLTVNVINPLTMGVDENSTLSALSLWPNPAREQFNISLDSELSGALYIEVVDLNGRVVMQQQERISTGSNRVMIATETLQAGLYAVRVSNGTTTISRRFVRN